MYKSVEESVVQREYILNIGKNRPNTNVAKYIMAYDEQEELLTLVALLEEIAKNSQFSTDFRISLPYYLDEFLRHAVMGDRSTIIAAGNILQYCGKIYGDRVEYMFQVVENQIDALLTAEPTKADYSSETPVKSVEQKKRRVKKLTRTEIDPYAITPEPRKFKTMPPEKRFSNSNFSKCTQNRTIEYLYQDHMSKNIWKNAPIVDFLNPYDNDEKKHYKLFTFHAEHRYNTLIPDIPFESLNLIKEYVYARQLNVSSILHGSMNTRDFLKEYIALENAVLENRYGTKSNNSQKRKTVDAENPAKKIRLIEFGQNLKQTETKSSEDTFNFLTSDNNVDSGIGIDDIGNSYTKSLEMQMDNSIRFNESNILESTRLSSLKTNDSIDDTPVNAVEEITINGNDNENSSKAALEDISPVIQNQWSNSNDEIGSTNKVCEEIFNVPRIKRYNLVLNVLQLQNHILRKERMFRLPKEFDIFKEARKGTRRKIQDCPKLSGTCDSKTQASIYPCFQNLNDNEFNENGDFLGFKNNTRRLTFDSGIEEQTATKYTLDDRRAAESHEELNMTLPMTPSEQDISFERINHTENDLSNQTKTNIENTCYLNKTITDADTEVMPLDDFCPLPINNDSTQSNLMSDSLESSPNTADMISDWHFRLGPCLEAAHQRQNFSIKDIGSEIIADCQKRKGFSTLENLMVGKDPSILCRYMLASLILTNQGNIALSFGSKDKDKPISLSTFKMKLLKTARVDVHPEDDVGNFQVQNIEQTEVLSLKRKSQSELPLPQVNLKTVRLIKPVPKSNVCLEEADSGISSLSTSTLSTPSLQILS